MKKQINFGMTTIALAATVLILSTPIHAEQVRLKIAGSTEVVMTGPSQKIYLKIALNGLGIRNKSDRAPVNVAIVLDKSGSMSGEKIEKAKEAAKMAVDLLRDDDIVSVITYDTSVEVIVPATKASEKWEIRRLIDRVTPGGNTALFSGVAKGAKEVRKFRDDRRVSRIILLSDGMANVGPSSPFELADLGASLVKEGISVTTIGLGDGYNEDLMSALARTSDGNHAFAENADDLARIFNYEFADLLSVVAKDVTVRINLGNHIRPIQVLGRKADIYGSTIVGKINQLYANQEKFFFIEVELPPSQSPAELPHADVSVEYDDMIIGKRVLASDHKTIRFSSSKDEADAGVNESVLVSSIELIANEQNQIALDLKDQGKDEEAKKILDENVRFLNGKADTHRSSRLKKLAEDNKKDKLKVGGSKKDWTVQRKSMRARQYEIESQMAW